MKGISPGKDLPLHKVSVSEVCTCVCVCVCMCVTCSNPINDIRKGVMQGGRIGKSLPVKNNVTWSPAPLQTTSRDSRLHGDMYAALT